jgi:hypothetical protein
MKSKKLSPFLWIGIAVIIVALISYFAIPGWKGIPGGVWILLGLVVPTVIGMAANLVAFAKDAKALQEEETLVKPADTTRVEAKGERSVAIGGSVRDSTIITGDDNEVKR